MTHVLKSAWVIWRDTQPVHLCPIIGKQVKEALWGAPFHVSLFQSGSKPFQLDHDQFHLTLGIKRPFSHIGSDDKERLNFPSGQDCPVKPSRPTSMHDHSGLTCKWLTGPFLALKSSQLNVTHNPWSLNRLRG